MIYSPAATSTIAHRQTPPDLDIEPESVDFHTSYTVLEHIPESIVTDILREGLRVIRPGGLFVHRIDYSDHFSHSDKSISSINFLQYSNEVWARIAGNRYMYMNRLREDDFVAIYEQAGHAIYRLESYVDSNAIRLLENGQLTVDDHFADKPVKMLATTGSWIVSGAPVRTTVEHQLRLV